MSLQNNTLMKSVVISLLFSALALLIAGSQLSQQCGWPDDWAGYVGQGQALSSGLLDHQRSLMKFTIDNSDIDFGPYAYPWGTPLVIAVVHRLFGWNVIAYKAFGIAAWIAFVFSFSLWSSKRLTPPVSLFPPLFFILHPGFRIYNSIGSDIPFLLLSFWSILGFETAFRIASPRKWWLVLVASISMFLAFLFRTNGIVILATIAFLHIVGWMPVRWRASIGLPNRLASKTLFGAWWLDIIPYTIFGVGLTTLLFCGMGGGDGHWQLLLEKIHPLGIGAHILYYIRDLTRWLDIPFLSYSTAKSNSLTIDRPLIVGFVLVLAIARVSIRRIQEEPVSFLFILGSWAVICLWPAYQPMRFLIPVMPFVVVWVTENATCTKIVARNRMIMSLLVLCFLGHLLFHSVELGSASASPSFEHALKPTAMDAYQAVRSHFSDFEPVVFHRPRILALLSDRPSFQSVQTNKILSLGKGVLVDRANDSVAFRSMIDEMESAGFIQDVFHNNDFTLYRIEQRSSPHRHREP